jgi:single-strand selective monofunctional uracil DNA glycosylase
VSLTRIARDLRRDVDRLGFAAPVTHVYNPLDYAWAPHRAYLERFGSAPKEALLLGMNPGPWGMAQTGVPFGDVTMVRGWLGITGKVARPRNEHPKRPVLGLDCARSEVSGTRLWGWARARFGTPEQFFARFLVWNYCPLSFMEASGRNRTPDKLPRAERDALYAVCDRALARVVRALGPQQVIGIGRFAADRCRAAVPDVPVVAAPHPSPASPAANRGWDGIFEAALAAAGVALPRAGARG